MGIDVYTAGLALHARNLEGSTGSRLLEAKHPLTSAGVAAARSSSERSEENVGVFGAVFVARRLATLAPGTAIGLPFGESFGPGFAQTIDQLDSTSWCDLPRILRALDGGAELDAFLAIDVEPNDPADEGSFMHERWDAFPGVAFARAVDLCNAIVLPSADSLALATGTVAIVSTAEGVRFFDAVTSRLGIDRRQLDLSYDDARSAEQNRLLYNLRLLHFHVGEADRSRRALGIWG